MLYWRVQPGGEMRTYTGPRPFRAVVIVEEPVTGAWRDLVSQWLIEADCLYMMAWGHDCSIWDDAVDHANLAAFAYGEIPDRHFVMTTWHEKESLADVFFYAKNNAFAMGPEEIRETLVLHISSIDREHEYAALFNAA